MEFAERLRALMAERGLSGLAVAREVPCDPAYVSRLINGKQRPSQRIARRLDEVLGADGTLATLVPPGSLWRLPGVNGEFAPDDEERLTLATQRRSRLDARAVEALAAVLAAQRDLEDRIGSAPMLVPVAAQVSAAEHLVSEIPARLRDQALGVTAQYGYFHGWLHENTGQLRQAVQFYDRALSQATEAGDVNLVSELISMKGHVAWARGDPLEVMRLSQAAQRDSRAFPGQHAISAMQEARALAVLGDSRAVTRKLSAADMATEKAAERDEDRPPWLYYHSPGFFTVQRGRVWLHLGAHDAGYNRKAIEALAAGVAALDATARASEWGVSYRLHLARAHMQADDAEQACAVAAEAASAARRLGSAGLLARLRRMCSRMAEQWPGHPAVAGLGEALR